MSGWQHYHHITEMPDGRRAGIQRLLFTVAVCVGIDDYGCWERRYCFATLADALAGLDDAAQGIEPTGYIARRPEIKKRAGENLMG